MKKKKKQLSLSKIVIVCLIILIPVAIGIAAVHKIHPKQKNSSQGTMYVQTDNSVVKYNQADVNKLLQLEQNRQKLSVQDQTIKNALIRRSSPLAMSDDYAITYDPAIDTFQAQINTISLITAKEEVVAWFTNQGMSAEGICKLPLSFTLEDSIVNSLQGLNIIFNPLPPGC